MLRSHRSRKLAARIALGAVTAALLVAVVVLVSRFQLEQERRAHDAATEYARYAQAEIEDTCRRKSEPERSDCARDAIASARQAQTQAHDLYAQQTVALWTTVMSVAAIIGVLLSTIGIYLIYATFQQTVRGARWAGVGARHSHRALTHMRRVADSELRPYLFVEKVEFEERTGGWHQVTVWFKNFGKIPARRISVISRCYVADDITDPPPPWISMTPIDAGLAAPGHHRRTFDSFLLLEDMFTSFEDQRYVILRIKYSYWNDDETIEYHEAVDYFMDHTAFQRKTFFLLTERSREKRARRNDLFATKPKRKRKRRPKAKKEGGTEQAGK